MKMLKTLWGRLSGTPPRTVLKSGGFVMRDIKNGACIPICTLYDLQHRAHYEVAWIKCDFKNCDAFFKLADEILLWLQKTTTLENVAEQIHQGMRGAELAMEIRAVSGAFAELNPPNPLLSDDGKNDARSVFYSEGLDSTRQLSDVMHNGHMMCVEMALLAKRWLENRGRRVDYLAHFYRDLKNERLWPHANLAVEGKGGVYIVDFALSTLCTKDIFPASGAAEKKDVELPYFSSLNNASWKRYLSSARASEAWIAPQTEWKNAKVPDELQAFGVVSSHELLSVLYSSQEQYKARFGQPRV